MRIEYALAFLEKIGNLYDIVCDDIKTDSAKILQYAFLNGHCGLAKIDNEYHVGMGVFTGKLNKDGIGTEYTITFLDGTQKSGTIDKDIVVLQWNNILHSTRNVMNNIAYMLADCDTSMIYNIKYSRVCPIPIVNSDIEEKSMKKVIDDLFRGVTKIFKRANSTSLLVNQTNVKDTLDLTKPETTTYLQNLSRFHEDWLQRACLELGINVSIRDKSAQLTSDELNSFKDYCAISADDTFCQLKEFSKKCKEVFNLNVKVKPKSFIYTEKDIENEERENKDGNN